MQHPDNNCLRLWKNSIVKFLKGEKRSLSVETIYNDYHKYMVAMDKLAIGNDEGIAFVHIAVFLLMDKW